mmetsp:Transcript_63282/g.127078  ORF Transcript_63282/g.127078 Transcript_63282/m.127078 type:complete len:297 (+) Transcript_63282:714-1604(+)
MPRITFHVRQNPSGNDATSSASSSNVNPALGGRAAWHRNGRGSSLSSPMDPTASPARSISSLTSVLEGLSSLPPAEMETFHPSPAPSPPPPPYSTVADMAVVADREYNIGSIVKATMGEQAILNVPVGQDNPNRLVFVLSPAGANGTIFRAELRVTSRRTETPFPSTVAGREAGFDVFEGARQVVTVERSAANAGGGGETGAMPKPQSKKGPPPLIKDIETTTLFTKIGDGKIEALQRTATFLVPSTNADPMKAAAIQRMGGRAVDVRTYRVIYTLKRRIGGQPQPKSNTNARDSA